MEQKYQAAAMQKSEYAMQESGSSPVFDELGGPGFSPTMGQKYLAASADISAIATAGEADLSLQSTPTRRRLEVRGGVLPFGLTVDCQSTHMDSP